MARRLQGEPSPSYRLLFFSLFAQYARRGSDDDTQIYLEDLMDQAYERATREGRISEFQEATEKFAFELGTRLERVTGKPANQWNPNSSIKINQLTEAILRICPGFWPFC